MRFREAGYRVAGAGKIFHHTDGFNPPDQWDAYFEQVFDDPWDRGALHHNVPAAPVPPRHPLNGIVPYEHEFDWGVLDRAEAEYGDAQAADWAIAELRRPRDRPLFLACGLFRPHLPCYAPRRYFDRYPLARVRLPALMDSDLERLPAVGAGAGGRAPQLFREGAGARPMGRGGAGLPGDHLFRRRPDRAHPRRPRRQRRRGANDHRVLLRQRVPPSAKSATGTSPPCGSALPTFRSSWRHPAWGGAHSASLGRCRCRTSTPRSPPCAG